MNNKTKPEHFPEWEHYTGWRIDTVELADGEEYANPTVEEMPLTFLVRQDFQYLEELEIKERVENGPDWIPFMAKVFEFQDDSIYLESCLLLRRISRLYQINNLTQIAFRGICEEDRRITKPDNKKTSDKERNLLAARTAYRSLRHMHSWTHSRIMSEVRKNG